jgi:hypothetical protein
MLGRGASLSTMQMSGRPGSVADEQVDRAGTKIIGPRHAQTGPHIITLPSRSG